MLAKVKRLAILSLGAGFIVLGILGLFLPILQGILFLCIGLMLLAHEWPPAQRLLDRLRHRYPRAAATFDEAERKIKLWFRRLAARFGNGGARGRRGEVRAAPPGGTGPDRGDD